eukprot:jgi/Chlat1/1785/Chrsp134S02117
MVLWPWFVVIIVYTVFVLAMSIWLVTTEWPGSKYHKTDIAPVPYQAVSRGWLLPAWALMLIRAVFFGYSLGVLIYDRVHYGSHNWVFFTVWTFTLLCVYFGFGTILSLCQILFKKHLHDRPLQGRALPGTDHGGQAYIIGDGVTAATAPAAAPAGSQAVDVSGAHHKSHDIYGQSNFTRFFVHVFVILHQTVVVSSLFVTMVVWAALYPISHDRSLLSFSSYSEHIVNSVYVVFCYLWGYIFCVFTWIRHSVSHDWPYSFMNLNKAAAVAWYPLIALWYGATFTVLYVLSRIKHRFVRKRVERLIY